MKIHLPAYPPGVHEIRETVEPKDLDLEAAMFLTPLRARLVLDRHDPYLQFQFEVEGRVRLQCDRCLADYERDLAVQTPMMYVLGRTNDAADVDDPDIVFVPAGTMDLDITADLRDFVILALPGKRLCFEGCKGLCPQCGADLNVQTCACSGPAVIQTE